jgi:hypothetical protein
MLNPDPYRIQSGSTDLLSKIDDTVYILYSQRENQFIFYFQAKPLETAKGEFWFQQKRSSSESSKR